MQFNTNIFEQQLRIHEVQKAIAMGASTNTLIRVKKAEKRTVM